MTHDTARDRAWIGTLGGAADQRDRVASALASAHDDDGAYFVAVSTESVDARVRSGAQTCKLDAAVLLVAADTGATEETSKLLRLLGKFDVPVVIAFVGRSGASRALRRAVQKLTSETLGYRAPHCELSVTEVDSGTIKRLAGEAQAQAAKHRRGGTTNTDYPFVISQTNLDRLMRQNVRHALEEHRHRGESVVVWRDGCVVELPSDAILLD